MKLRKSRSCLIATLALPLLLSSACGQLFDPTGSEDGSLEFPGPADESGSTTPPGDGSTAPGADGTSGLPGGSSQPGGELVGVGDDPNCAHDASFPALAADPANTAYPDPTVSVRCTDTTVVVEANGIPTYEYVPMTPNGLAAQGHVWEIPRSPALAAGSSEIPLLGTAGFAVNGLPIFGPNEADFPDPYGDPIYNAITDECLGHTGQGGTYHYHALVVQCVLENLGYVDGSPSPIIGYALDGFPIYGPWDCVDADCSDVIKFESGYMQVGDPTTYAWDAHEFIPSSERNVLDECNGRVGPDGTYRYHATDMFPYILGCYAGTPLQAGGGQLGGTPPDGGTPPEVGTPPEEGSPPEGGTPPEGGAVPGGDGATAPGGTPPMCADISATQRCCGDGLCDGPETSANCAADCS